MLRIQDNVKTIKIGRYAGMVNCQRQSQGKLRLSVCGRLCEKQPIEWRMPVAYDNISPFGIHSERGIRKT